MSSPVDDPADRVPGQPAAPSELDVAALRAEAEALGLVRLAFRDESSAPEVDHQLLLDLAGRQLSEPVARLVYRLVYSYPSWHEAFTQAVIQYARRRREQQ